MQIDAGLLHQPIERCDQVFFAFQGELHFRRGRTANEPPRLGDTVAEQPQSAHEIVVRLRGAKRGLATGAFKQQRRRGKLLDHAVVNVAGQLLPRPLRPFQSGGQTVTLGLKPGIARRTGSLAVQGGACHYM